MKISVNNKTVYELNEIRKKVIQNDIPEEIFMEDMERRVAYIIQHKYERCFERLKKEWEPKLQTRMTSIPTDPDELASLILMQPDYKSRSQKIAEEKKRERTEHN